MAPVFRDNRFFDDNMKFPRLRRKAQLPDMRFHDLKEAPAGKKFIVWAVGPDNTFTKLGQVVNTQGRNEAEIKSEVNLPDFGLLVTMEDADVASPAGPGVAHIHIVP